MGSACINTCILIQLFNFFFYTIVLLHILTTQFLSYFLKDEYFLPLPVSAAKREAILVAISPAQHFLGF